MKYVAVPSDAPSPPEPPVFFRDAVLPDTLTDPLLPPTEPQPAVVEESWLQPDVLDFHGPDEDLRVQDVLPGLDVPTADREAERAEFQGCVRTALAALPRAWLHVLELQFAEDLAPCEVARRTGVSEEELPAVVDHARALLRARLEESGCRFTS